MNKIQKAHHKLNQKLVQYEDEIPCFYESPDIFDPEMFDDYHTRLNAIKVAKDLCSICPAKQECFDYGYKSSASAMIWGGVTVPEMIKMKYRNK